ncbi:MAG: nucleotide 5'-monophosphate nucleosidase PpnN [Xanthomonadales bacterium]|jgi:predicted Rossmann-fold nucleotide-binding protein|nr:nucleotide 5'-monophosphate nucleosidase PpnN [Xanthomonadales bacterium]
MSAASVSTRVYPAGMLYTLSRNEVERLQDITQGDLAELVRRCSLAVLNSGHESDDAEALLEQFSDYQIEVQQVNRGLRLQLSNAPGTAFVDGQIIEGIREQLSSVVRDLVYFDSEIKSDPYHDLESSAGITGAVFEVLRNAGAFIPEVEPDLVVCWGGHSIAREEYEYTKNCGYQLGLRLLNIITGCGPGAMKGPMKGATIAHSKQRKKNGRYIGVSEPGIIAAESPNPIVNNLIILPDIEKRLEAFVRLGHGIVVFPGGAGTAEEILYLLGILLHPANADTPFPVVLTGPAGSASYFEQIDQFIRLTLGKDACSRYKVIVDNPEAVASYMKKGLAKVRKYRVRTNDAFYFNWLLKVEASYQATFEPTHDNMRALELSRDLPTHELACNLRKMFSGIVAGNVKPDGVRSIREKGPFEIQGDPEIMRSLDALLGGFVRDHRMKLPGGKAYQPCYRLVL